MVDYVEDPIGRIVNVHWDDDGKPPPPPELPVRMCGTYNFSYQLGSTSPGIIEPIADGADGDPFMIRDTSDPSYGHYPYSLVLTQSGIAFGRGTRVLMTPATYTISADWDLSNSTDENTYGLLLIHTAGPRDWYRYPEWGLPMPPQPYQPILTFPGGSFSWTYEIYPGANGQVWQPKKTGTGAQDIVWDDPTRFDPSYGGDAWIRVLWRANDDPQGLWREILFDAFWAGGMLGPEITQGWLEWSDPPVFHPGSSAYGQRAEYHISSTCLPDPPGGARHEDPVSVHDDGTIGNLG